MKMRAMSELKLSVTPTVLALAMLSTPCFAQAAAPVAPGATTPDDTPVIVVTGTRISRSDLKSISPVSVVTADDLKMANASTPESFLTQNSQFVAGLTSATNNGSGGIATVDLRGLGDQRTLVLIDGRRMVPATIGGEVDIDAIPSVLIQRVEVLTGGASAVYGADAIAGVVNFVLDDKLVGVKGDASEQVTQQGDGEQRDISLAAGVKLGDSGHFVIAGEYTSRQGVYEGARSYSAQNLESVGLTPSGSSNAYPTVIDINAGRYQLNSAGNFAVCPNGTCPNPYNYNPANYFQVPLKRYNVTAIGSYEVAPSVELYGRASYTRVETTAILAPTATAGFNFTISPNNPYLNADNKALIFGDPLNINPDGTANVAIRRRVIETGGRIENFRNDVYYGVGGVRGDLGTSLKYDVFAQYGETKSHQDLLNDLDYNKISQAINAVPGPGGGAPVCADPSGGCVPINLFALNGITPAALQFVSANGSQDNKYTQFVTGASLAGDLGFVKSPFAEKPAAFSAGVEYRSETGDQLVDPNYGSGNMIYYGQGTNVPEASFNVKEVFGELKVPLASDQPFLRELSLEGGIRYSAYTNHTTGGTNKNNQITFKFGGEWEPVYGLRFRAMYNRATRDPNIKELNSPVTQNGTDVLQTDPCAGNNHPGNDPTTTAICIAQGAPAAKVTGNSILDVISNQTNINGGGNTALKPETANTFTVGMVVNPQQMRNFNFTIDYYNMKITNYIATDSAQDISNQCFQNHVMAYCSLIVRNNINGQLTGSPNANGVFPGVGEVNVNIASLKTQGIDVSADYKFSFADDTSLRLGFAGTYVGQWLYSPGVPGSSPTTCLGKFGNICTYTTGNPIPRWKHTASVTYQGHGWSIDTKWRMIGEVSEDAGTSILKSHIPAYNYFDSTVTFDLSKAFKLRVGVQNLTDTDPPVVGGAAGSAGTNAGNTFPQIYDFLGRTFFVGVSAKI
jgi:outer membrane receptor protein involved in Fe transport